MESYQIQIIRDAYNRCFGLKEGVQYEGTLQAEYIKALANQTGIRLEYLQQNISIIRSL